MKKMFALGLVLAACSSIGTIKLAAQNSQIIACSANDDGRKYCRVDTRGGVRLYRQTSDTACTQGSTWGYDDRGVWVDGGCRAEFEVMGANGQYGTSQTSTYGSTQTVRCESDNGQRRYCAADTSAGVQLTRRLSNDECTRGSSWGTDDRGIWVDNGCRAEFEVQAAGYGQTSTSTTSSTSTSGPTQTVRCESYSASRRYCAVDTSGGVRLARRTGYASCTQDSTWGYDTRGIWVSNNCRADFEVTRAYADQDNSGSEDRVLQNINCGTTGTARRYCTADTRGGVRLARQLSTSPCTQGTSWGYNQRGIWVARRCRGNFDVLASDDANTSTTGSTSTTSTYGSGQGRTFRCESNSQMRTRCAVDTRGGVRMTRQLSSTACTQNSTWGYDNSGVWVSNGCRAEFTTYGSTYGSGNSSSGGYWTTIPAGTEISIRTNDAIDSKAAREGQTYGATVATDVQDASGRIVIPRGSDAQLLIKSVNGGNVATSSDLVLDVASLTVNGTRYIPSTGDLEQKATSQGIGANKKTATMVGGGAALGAIIGAIAGQGKGAAIGAAIGAAAGGAGVVLTKGKEVNVPAETVLNFRLDQDLRLQAAQ